MFKLAFSTIMFQVAFSIAVLAQEDWQERVPKDREELAESFAKSTSPEVLMLDDDVKSAMLDEAIFENEMFAGFSNKDSKISVFNALDERVIQRVLCSLLRVNIIVVSGPLPAESYNADGFNGLFRAPDVNGSYCKNCQKPPRDFTNGGQQGQTKCCDLGGNGCMDWFIYNSGTSGK
ncbi:MAG: hypothetical protein U0T73_11875 [Chitinophagales bacterium]